MSNVLPFGPGAPVPFANTPAVDAPSAGAPQPPTAPSAAGPSEFSQAAWTSFNAGPASVAPLPVAPSDPAPGLPASVNLGFDAIHFYSIPGYDITITVSSPMPTLEAPGVVVDSNARPPHEPLPERFILGDGGTTRAFIGVDKRPGTPLSKWLDAIIADIAQPITFEGAVEFLRTECNKRIAWTAGSRFNDGRAEFPWDKAITLPANYKAVQSEAGGQIVANPPLDTCAPFPVVPFERYLEEGKGYCIQKALLAALVLDRLGMPFRLVNGAVGDTPGKSTGHTWIELVDGRILDVAWGSLSQRGDAHPSQPGWFRFGLSYRFENWDYPMLVLT